MEIIADIHNDLPNKFGAPRQSGLVDEMVSTIVFRDRYRDPNALRGIEEYSHLWLLWEFSENGETEWSPTVRPPRLGGNKRMGVFATRSPFRPNPIGLSCVKLLSVESNPKNGTVLIVSGADLIDNTPIIDIKPYLPYSDSHPDAKGGFGADRLDYALDVTIPDGLAHTIPADKLPALKSLLRQDPRPAYHDDPGRIYGFFYAGHEIRFTVSGNELTVTDISPAVQE